MNVRVAQLGARMHYAVPRIVAEAGALESFHTDLYASARWKALAEVPRAFRSGAASRLLDRVVANVPTSRIVTHATFGLHYYLRQHTARTAEQVHLAHMWAGKRFAELSSRKIERATAVYAFNSAALELFEAAKERGVTTVLEMTIAPRAVEAQLLNEGLERWPRWRGNAAAGPAWLAAAAREREEWKLAAKIVCASTFVKDALKRCGGPAERCHVVPYGVALPSLRAPKRRLHRPLRVLTAGSMTVRKGIPVVLEAARSLSPGFEFRLVGDGTIPSGEELPQHVDSIGSVPRSAMAEHYRWADVFLLPSLCEGSATVTYEALGYGLPVICTPNAGSVVRNGFDGFVVPVFQSGPIIDCLTKLAESPGVLESMSEAARASAERWDLAAYAANLRRVLGLGESSHDN